MKDYVAKRSRQSVSKNDILAINNLAKEDRRKGNHVINASTGVFLNEKRVLEGVPMINESMKEYISQHLGYPSVYGNPGYLEDILSFVFGEKEAKVKERFVPFIGATMGGTGAISIAFHLFLEDGQSVLLPDIMWTNYLLIAKKARVTSSTYMMFDEEGKFNLASVKESIENVGKTNGKVLLVINDPCQNPTGYCLDEEEYHALFSLLEEEGEKYELTVLFDIAYLAFFSVPGEKCALMECLVETDHSFLPLIAFSCSKVFGLYGLRVGALIALAENATSADEIRRAFGAQARGTYSVSNGAVQAAVHEVLKNPEKRDLLNREIEANTALLRKRSKALLEELEEKNIPHYPYKSGFFVTLKVKDAYLAAEKLKREHIYVVPMDEHSLRLAISGMTEEEIHEIMEAYVRIVG